MKARSKQEVNGVLLDTRNQLLVSISILNDVTDTLTFDDEETARLLWGVQTILEARTVALDAAYQSLVNPAKNTRQ